MLSILPLYPQASPLAESSLVFSSHARDRDRANLPHLSSTPSCFSSSSAARTHRHSTRPTPFEDFPSHSWFTPRHAVCDRPPSSALPAAGARSPPRNVSLNLTLKRAGGNLTSTFCYVNDSSIGGWSLRVEGRASSRHSSLPSSVSGKGLTSTLMLHTYLLYG